MAVVDIHMHMYPPSYVKLLEARADTPLVRTFAQAPEPRLVVLEAEARELKRAARDKTAPGRLLTVHFTSLEQKVRFMDRHRIDVSIVSLANPWLDFVDAAQAGAAAETVNGELGDMCARHPGRLFFFGTLPLTAPVETARAAVAHLRALKRCRGVIMGTAGRGRGLDDPELAPMLEAVAAAGLPVFVHPHDGLAGGDDVWGPRAAEHGHVLPLALGFPMQTTVAVTRMYLAGVLDRVRGLRLILAHSGGTLPFLAGHTESCICHDARLVRKGKAAQGRRSVWDVLKEQVYLDAVVYSDVGLKAAIAASGADRLMFGTDHPFFPPLTTDKQGEWESVSINVDAVNRAVGEGSAEAKAIMGDNAVRVLGLQAKP